MICDDHPDLFASVEAARTSLRYYRGQRGEAHRKKLKSRAHVVKSGDSRRSPTNGEVIPTDVKILIFDIETSPNMGYFWRCWKQNIHPTQILTEVKVMSWAAKWLGADEVLFDSIQSDMTKDATLQDWIEQDDSRVCSTIYELFNQADIVVAHNGQAFDTAMLNSRWAAIGFPPPQPYRVMDTLKVARKVFNFPHNSLEGIARYFDLGGKLEHEGFPLWTKCMSGDMSAWKKMEEYNIQDVLLLEKVYLKLRAWDKFHPAVNVIIGGCDHRCKVCGSTKTKEIKHKSAYTNVSEFPSFRCGNCGAVMRGPKRYKPTGEILRTAL